VLALTQFGIAPEKHSPSLASAATLVVPGGIADDAQRVRPAIFYPERPSLQGAFDPSLADVKELASPAERHGKRRAFLTADDCDVINGARGSTVDGWTTPVKVPTALEFTL